MPNASLPAAPSGGFDLHPQLARDTIALGELALSRLLVMTDATFPWLVLVPRRAGITEIIDLPAAERAVLMDEIARVSEALKAVTGCDKLNIAALGNIVSQLHIHVVARRIGDPAWPGPVWGAVPPKTYAPEALAAFTDALRRRIDLGGAPAA